MRKYSQNKGKEIVNKIKAEEWYEEGVIMNRQDFIEWLFQRKEKNAQD